MIVVAEMRVANAVRADHLTRVRAVLGSAAQSDFLNLGLIAINRFGFLHISMFGMKRKKLFRGFFTKTIKNV